ncbi:MAG: DinB family protein [Saprospiraceae bacterium]
MQLTPWFERKFELINDNGRLPTIIERLAGTPIRIEQKVLQFADDFLIKHEGDDWSIQEQVGHLLNLEWLWYARITDIINGEAYLTEADLTNTATYEAKYNEQNIEAILDAFIEVRKQLVALLRSVKVDDLNKQSLHPRLQTPMKIIDLAFFIAEHDDHHLAIIQKISQ